MSTENKTDWKEREVGALWKKESATQKFFSGHVKIVDDDGEETLVKVVVFSNRHKSKDSHPDFRIYTVDDKKPVAKSSSKEEVETEEVL
ncbi:MAG: hypothetical protein CMI54_05940 [Parcubacteria group bacterium]|nr:hypothetical protein [Parcubacteria group bacterium]|tara:strand:+ start:20461 stop:20727 length:267 start_codon:yes stop_codon:yes gene_type:complete